MEELINEGYRDYFTLYKSFLLQFMYQLQVNFIESVLRDVPSEVLFMCERARNLFDDFIMIFLEVKLPDIASHKYIKRIHEFIVAVPIGPYTFIDFLVTPFPNANLNHFLQILFGEVYMTFEIVIG